MDPVLTLKSGPLPEGSPLRVASFNIRNCRAKDGENGWEFRRPLVRQLLAETAADIWGFQEAYSEQVEFLAAALPGYAYAGVGRDDGREAGEFAAIFYRQDRFSLLEQETFWLSRTPAVPGSKYPGARCIRVATRACLKCSDTQQRLLVFNTHLDHEALAAQRHGVALIKESARETAREAPAILMGDFNCTPQDEAYLDAIRGDGFQFRDARTHAGTPPQGPAWTFHGFKPPGVICIDHVLVGPGLRVAAFRTIDFSIAGRWPSDHLPVVADLILA